MFSLGGNQRIYYCPHPVNLRKSFDGLAGAVQEYIGRDPVSEHLFVFFSRNKKLVKMIFYQDGGCVFLRSVLSVVSSIYHYRRRGKLSWSRVNFMRSCRGSSRSGVTNGIRRRHSRNTKIIL